MTDAPYDEQGVPDGEEARASSPPGSFGDEAADLANESFETVAGQSPQETTEDDEQLSLADELVVTKMALAERTGDLQRLQAEFVNYKRRVDRDRDLIRENATYTALAPITEVLDTIDRAREHGPLDGGFKAVADQLERIVTSLGLTKFGAVGDRFDPTIHEALSHIGEDPEVSVTTCKVIAKAGYRIGDRVVRAAQVLVVDPPSGGPPSVGPPSVDPTSVGATGDPGVEEPGDPDSAPTD
ncbi:nucleotide exchange factor GrpE [Nocardioides sp.]|uniref:nucleotide exchange factor GrpE n=1 Tax=Nocardioides sp. TaxID=35761 RepID=UPI0031FF1428|nr:GrpE protein [Nocardioides sp.]